MKTGLKVIYVILALIVCIFAYILSYSTNMYEYIYGITNTAIENKDYVETAMIHGGCFEKVDLVNQTNDNVNVAIFRAASLSQYSYTNESDEEVEVDKYEFSYYIFIYPGDSLSIDYSDYSDTSNTYNQSGIKFYNGDNSYSYYFEISDSINSSLYVESPTSYNAAILNSSRDWLEYNTNYGFINFTFDQSLLQAINDTNDNKFDKVTKIEILDSHGNVQRTIDITLDFTGDFFTDVKPLTDKYTEYLEVYNSSASDDEKEVKEEEFTTFSETFQTEFLAKSDNYTLRHEDSYLQPSSITWQSIGTVVLFVVCAVLIYFLLFHFKFIKNIFNRNSRKYDRYSTSTGKKAGTIITAENIKTKNDSNKNIINQNDIKNDKIIEENIVEPKFDSENEKIENVNEESTMSKTNEDLEKNDVNNDNSEA